MTKIEKTHTTKMAFESGTRAEIVRRVKAQLREEILLVRRASREHRSHQDPIKALWSEEMDASPAANRARGFLCAVALILEVQASALVEELASDVPGIALDPDPHAYDNVPF